MTYGIGVWSIEEAVDLALGVVEEFDLPNTELICFAVLRVLRYLIESVLG